MRAARFTFVPGRIHLVSSAYEDFGGPWPEKTGLKLSVVVSTDDAFLTGIWTNSEYSELYEFRDNTGLDLLAEGGGESAVGVSNNFKSALFEISSYLCPSPTASRIEARGQLLVSTASGSNHSKSDAIFPKVGLSVSVAGFEFQIAKLGKPEYEEDGVEIEFHRSTQREKLRNVARIYFEDCTGKKLDIETVSSSSRGAGDDFEVQDKYIFPNDVREFIIVVESWENRFEQHVSYELATTIGLGDASHT